MRELWEQEHRLGNYLKVEAALALSLAELGKIPKEAAQEISSKASPRFVTLERVAQIELETKHDLMAVIKALTEQCGEAGKFVHTTATSYDIVDTAQALQVRDSLQILFEKCCTLLEALLKQAEAHSQTVMAGRTHGQHALPITFGFKLANYAQKLGGDAENLKWDCQNLVQGKFSGAVGTYSAQKSFGVEGSELEQKIMLKLGLKAAPISTQVVAREGLARIVCDVAVLAGTLEQIAKEIRNLQRTEIGEASEPFGEKQVGSSTMAQKRNPIDCENVCGNARMVRSCVAPALENIALEHERDLTNSSAERSLLPTVFLLADDMLDKMAEIISGLQVYPQKMKGNLELGRGAMMAEAVITQLVKKGAGRQEAHEIARKASMAARDNNSSLKQELEKEKTINEAFSASELETLFDYSNYTGSAKEKTLEVVSRWRAKLSQWSESK